MLKLCFLGAVSMTIFWKITAVVSTEKLGFVLMSKLFERIKEVCHAVREGVLSSKDEALLVVDAVYILKPL